MDKITRLEISEMVGKDRDFVNRMLKSDSTFPKPLPKIGKSNRIIFNKDEFLRWLENSSTEEQLNKLKQTSNRIDLRKMLVSHMGMNKRDPLLMSITSPEMAVKEEFNGELYYTQHIIIDKDTFGSESRVRCCNSYRG